MIAGVLVPELGVEEDFDQSQAGIEGIVEQLQDHLKSYCTMLKFVLLLHI